MIAYTEYGAVELNSERCECDCGCRTARNLNGLLWAESGGRRVKVWEMNNPDPNRVWHWMCRRCYQDEHSVYEQAVMAAKELKQ